HPPQPARPRRLSRRRDRRRSGAPRPGPPGPGREAGRPRVGPGGEAPPGARARALADRGREPQSLRAARLGRPGRGPGQPLRLAAALLAAGVAHTPEGEEVLRGARMRAARKPSAVARELLRNFPKSGSRRRRRKKKGGSQGKAARKNGAAAAANGEQTEEPEL